MVSPQDLSSIAATNNSSEQHYKSDRSDSTARVPLKLDDWEQPDFEEIDVCMEVTAYIYHWQ